MAMVARVQGEVHLLVGWQAVDSGGLGAQDKRRRAVRCRCGGVMAVFMVQEGCAATGEVGRLWVLGN